MNEGIGSTTILVVIAVFIAIVSAYLAYNVNYTKAFRMKNKIVSLYEEYNGQCFNDCQAKIRDYARDIGYNPYRSLNCPTQEGTVSTQEITMFYCEYKMPVDKSKPSDDVFVDSGDQYYYRILTRIDIQIRIIQNVLKLRVLNVTGDTKAFDA